MNTTADAIRRACTAQTTLPTPLGAVLFVRTAQGLAGAWFAEQKHHPGDFAAPQRADDALLQRAAALFLASLTRSAARDEPLELALDLHGTPFQCAVWRALMAIPRGTTRSYGQIAQAIGAPRAVRAVGGAIARNPLLVLVPCHRVVGGDGSMTGYAGGLERKRALLELEREALANA